jgi:hypothetical protein
MRRSVQWCAKHPEERLEPLTGGCARCDAVEMLEAAARAFKRIRAGEPTRDGQR